LTEGYITDNSHSLGEQMRRDWDRRIAHDYRYWMSDGVEDDQAMWESGKRDFESLKDFFERLTLPNKFALELGCGVGRLIPYAAEYFEHVIGVDVSAEAIKQAETYLHSRKNVNFQLSDGVSLKQLSDSSIGCIYSFGMFGNIPINIAASYLIEMQRILVDQGIALIQIYLGAEQVTTENDTLAIRSYQETAFKSALELAGFELIVLEKFIIPFETSVESAEFEPYIAVVKKTSCALATQEKIASTLQSEQEQLKDSSWKGSKTEYLMAVNRAYEQIDAGRLIEAKKSLEFALQSYLEPESEILELLALVRAQVGKTNVVEKNTEVLVKIPSKRSIISNSKFQEIFEKNLRCLQDYFPAVARAVEAQDLTKISEYQVDKTASGEYVIIYKNTPLDNRYEPRKSAQNWARSLKLKGERCLVVGFAGGFHLEEFLHLGKEIAVIEPNIELLRVSLATKDFTAIIPRLKNFYINRAEIQKDLSLKPENIKIELLIHPTTQLLQRDEVFEIKRTYWSIRGNNELRPNIAVVGPIYGGTLPLAVYSANALLGLQQKTRSFDFSAFEKPYFEVMKCVHNKNKQNFLQTHYVEFLSQTFMETVNEQGVDIVISLAQAPLSPRILTELRERGIITVQWFVEDCRRFLTWQHIARYYDYMFLIQKGEFLTDVENAGAGRAIYLPVGCDPMVHRPVELTTAELSRWGSDLSFVGAGYNNRQQLFSSLTNRNFKIWGTEWPGVAPFDQMVQEGGRRISPDEYVKIFSATKINLNLHSSSERDGVDPTGDFVNPRTFELAASGAFQLVDKRSLIPDLFEEGKEVITFADRHELEHQIDYYLQHPAERNTIALAARKRALTDHTYLNRLQTLLGYIYADRFEDLKRREEESPWTKTLKASEVDSELNNRFIAVNEKGAEPKLENLVADIQLGKGSLTLTEQKLLFLYHVKSQIQYANDLQQGKAK
jgi:spore maturation protein CgeB